MGPKGNRDMQAGLGGLWALEWAWQTFFGSIGIDDRY